MKNVGKGPKIVKDLQKSYANFLGVSERNLLIFRGVFVIFCK